MDGQRNLFYNFGPFRIDTRERLLLRNGEPVPLPPKVYDTLLALVENSGHTIGKEQLMSAVWPDTYVEDANLTVNISALRKALGEGVSGQRYIETVPRRGYRFVPTVTGVNNDNADLPGEGGGETRGVIEEQSKAEAEGEKSFDGEEHPLPPGVFATLRRRRGALVMGFSALLIVLSVAAYYSWTKRAGQGLGVKSIAVLPFKPLVADSRDEPLEVGMCDALITRLGRLNQLIVRPTSSVLMYNRPGQDPLAAGRELGVDALLDGYVQRSGERIRVTAQLLNVADGRHLWSGQFNVNFTDIFAVEDSISRQMVEALLLKLTGDEQRLVTRHHTEDVEAYELYLKGRYFQEKRTPEGTKKSIEFFQQATEKDPNYSLAFAGLAESYVILAIRADMPPHESYLKAKTAATRAIEIDDTTSEAHVALAHVRYWYDWDWVGAESEFRRAIDLNLNYAIPTQYYASYLMAVGRHQEAVSEIKRVQRIAPLSLNINVQAARIHYFLREYDEAIEQCLKTLEMDPTYGGARLFLGRAYKQKRMYKEALAELEIARNLLGDSAEVLSLIGQTYAVSGQRVEAQKVLEELRELSKQRYVSPYHVAMVYAGLGEQDMAFEWLEKAYTDREGRMTILRLAPEFDGLRSDLRFADLVKRVGLAP